MYNRLERWLIRRGVGLPIVSDYRDSSVHWFLLFSFSPILFISSFKADHCIWLLLNSTNNKTLFHQVKPHILEQRPLRIRGEHKSRIFHRNFLVTMVCGKFGHLIYVARIGGCPLNPPHVFFTCFNLCISPRPFINCANKRLPANEQ